jgi:hypothetical protein
VQGGTTHELNIEVPHAERARGRLAHGGEGFRQEVVELLAILVARPEPVCFFAQFRIRKGLERVFKGVNGISIVPQLPQELFVTCAENFFD